jgi:type IV secretory pathway VirB10-like protein
MSEDRSSRGDPPKVDSEGLVLRARPRRVIRFKRRVVLGLAAVASFVVFGATWLALEGPTFHPRLGDEELYSTSRKSTPDGLGALPNSYDQIKRPAPQLGPPLPGDLGPPVVRQEQNLGLSSNLKPNPEDDADRAERMRLAQQARQAREAGVFFQLSRNGSTAPAEDAAARGTTAEPQAGPPMGGASAIARLNLDLERDQNDQQRKLDFLNQQVEPGISNPHGIQEPVSPYEILAGTVISASLITGLNSDLPGLVLAQITEDVYDTVTGKVLLIPQGSRLIGSYDSVIAFGQSRALVIWQRIVMPDGSSIQIDNLPATDTAGYAGLEGEVDYHTWTLLKGVALSTLLGIGGQVTFGTEQSDLVQAIRESTQESTNQAGQRMVEKDLNIQPTIIVRPGWPLRVIVHKDLVLRPHQG